MGHTVLIVDDHRAFRLLARELLESEGYLVVGEASDAVGAVEATARFQPDIVLLDVRLPDGSGLDVAKALRGQASPPLVVLISTADYAQAVASCGAAGFIPKGRLSAASLRKVIDAA